MQVNPYLTFNGNCEEAFKTYQKILGGEIAAMIPHEGTPAEESVPPEWRKKIVHARLVSNGMVLMGSDAPPDRYQPMKGFSVTVNTKKPAEAERIFNAPRRQGDRGCATWRDLFRRKICDTHRQVWHALDDRLREAAVTSGGSVHGGRLDPALV